VGISGPIRGAGGLHARDQPRRIHQRSPVRGASEISELAENFNKMAGDIEEYIERLKEAAEENRELFIGSIRMLAAAIDEKDPYTPRSLRGSRGEVFGADRTGAGLSTEELDKLRIAALLHDVGKIGVEDRVLKKPGSLTPEEFGLMKQHTVKGANIMRPVSQLKEMLPGIELHHEHMDGRGYPYGLQGQQIPLMARIIGVADTLDAMTTNRPYQSAMELDYAMDAIRALTGSKFDAVVVTALESAVNAGSSASPPSKFTSSLFADPFHEGTQKGFPMRSEQPRFKLTALRRRNELLCRIDMWGFVSVMLCDSRLDKVWPAYGAVLTGHRCALEPTARCSERGCQDVRGPQKALLLQFEFAPGTNARPY